MSETFEICEIIIRPATSDDVEAISRLLSGLSRRFITPEYTPQGAATLLSHQTPEAIAKCLDEGMHYLVAEVDNTLVGAAGLIRERRHLYHLFVDADRHDLGIGRRLWSELIAGLEPGPITVNSSKVAIGFYERLGFCSNGPLWEKDGVIAWPMIRQPLPPQTPAAGDNLSSS
jgi:ribosomal protein S18 acetylase RimI-like enzyme